jgi:hypothetical protein
MKVPVNPFVFQTRSPQTQQRSRASKPVTRRLAQPVLRAVIAGALARRLPKPLMSAETERRTLQ